MSKIVIAGGSGFVGRELTRLLRQLGHDVVALSRTGKAPDGARGVTWDAHTVGPWAAELEAAKAVINLVGESAVRKWTKEAKIDILHSRLRSTQAIGQAIGKATSPPTVWINASAVGYYGNRGAEELVESSGPGARRDFLVDTCVAWEAAVDEFALESTRKVKLRTGIVLGKDGGAFPDLLKLTKWFLGGPLGSGRQYISWIHAKDNARLIVHCMEHELTGAINATSPEPVTNRFFMAVLRGVMGRPWAMPVPAWLLGIANWFGAPEPSVLLASTRAIPKVALESGFRFEFDDLRDAVRNLTASD